MTMELKQEIMYRDDTLLIKTEPRLHSPCATGSNGMATMTTASLLAGVAPLGVSANGLASLAIVTSHSANANGNGLSSVTLNGLSGNSSYNSVGTSSNKRPRNEDWLSSTSPGTISVSAPPLTPSPGPQNNNQQYTTVISNGYSSPMSSGGSYDPYSPNGKIGKLHFY